MKQAQHYGVRLQAPLLPGQEVLAGGLPDLPAPAGRARASLGASTSPRFLSRITLTLAVASALSNRTSHNKAPGSNTPALPGETAVLFSATGPCSFPTSQSPTNGPTSIIQHLFCRQRLKQVQQNKNGWVYTSEEEEAPRAHPGSVGLRWGGSRSMRMT